MNEWTSDYKYCDCLAGFGLSFCFQHEVHEVNPMERRTKVVYEKQIEQKKPKHNYTIVILGKGKPQLEMNRTKNEKWAEIFQLETISGRWSFLLKNANSEWKWKMDGKGLKWKNGTRHQFKIGMTEDRRIEIYVQQSILCALLYTL